MWSARRVAEELLDSPDVEVGVEQVGGKLCRSVWGVAGFARPARRTASPMVFWINGLVQVVAVSAPGLGIGVEPEAGKTYCQPQSRSAPACFSASANGRGAWPRPHRRPRVELLRPVEVLLEVLR